MAQVEKTIFREYDLRGKVNDQEVNENSAEIIAKGFATFLNKRGIGEVVIGYDSREYSPRLQEAFIKGLVSSGVKVTKIGRVITPVMYFAQYQLKIKGGVCVTASHNPNGWAGFKLAYGYSTTLLPNDIKELQQYIENDEFISGQGEIKEYSGIYDDYEKMITDKIKLNKKLKVAVDCGNGTAGEIAPRVLKALGCEVVEQFSELDYNFPNHEPNPSLIESQQALAELVKRKKVDIGFGFDGDGDRVGFADENGKVIFPDEVLILLARLALKKQPGGAIVFDVKSTQGLTEDIKAHGGIPVMWITGHSYIKQKVKETKAILGGETSGHVFYNQDYYGYDDAIFAAAKLLEYLSNSDKTFSEEMTTIPQYIKSPTFQTHCDDKIKYEVVDKLVKELKKDFGEDKVIDINGARVVLDDGWFLVRASSNLPVLTLLFEAKTEQHAEELKNTLKSYLDKHPEISPDWESG